MDIGAIRPGTRVMVVSPRELLRLNCHHQHYAVGLPLEDAVGVVDRIDRRFRDHRVVVVFPTIHTPPFGSAWVDVFAPDELVPVAG